MRQLKRNKEEGFVNWGSRLMFLPYLIDGELHQARNVDEFIGDILDCCRDMRVAGAQRVVDALERFDNLEDFARLNKWLADKVGSLKAIELSDLVRVLSRNLSELEDLLNQREEGRSRSSKKSMGLKSRIPFI